MGTWGHLAFNNDTTNDWAYGLEEVDDLSLVEAALDELEEVGNDYLDQDIACNALGACEVLARLLGHPGYTNAFTETVDQWVAGHKVKPPPALLERRVRCDRPNPRRRVGASSVVGRKRGRRPLRKAMEDLRGRLRIKRRCT